MPVACGGGVVLLLDEDLCDIYPPTERTASATKSALRTARSRSRIAQADLCLRVALHSACMSSVKTCCSGLLQDARLPHRPSIMVMAP